METISGQITKKDIEEGISRVGKPYMRCVFLINDKKYSTFDENIMRDNNVGDFVDMKGVQKGQYWNMTEMKKSTGEAPVQNLPVEPAKSVNMTDDLLRMILSEVKAIREQKSV